ncbi:hypothetical protein DIPPA_22544 [Diplonema papillatum]|nr:hypothetical protein DIPPA_22544 [Diplonema papillatum]
MFLTIAGSPEIIRRANKDSKSLVWSLDPKKPLQHSDQLVRLKRLLGIDYNAQGRDLPPGYTLHLIIRGQKGPPLRLDLTPEQQGLAGTLWVDCSEAKPVPRPASPRRAAPKKSAKVVDPSESDGEIAPPPPPPPAGDARFPRKVASSQTAAAARRQSRQTLIKALPVQDMAALELAEAHAETIRRQLSEQRETLRRRTQGGHPAPPVQIQLRLNVHKTPPATDPPPHRFPGGSCYAETFDSSVETPRLKEYHNHHHHHPRPQSLEGSPSLPPEASGVLASPLYGPGRDDALVHRRAASGGGYAARFEGEYPPGYESCGGAAPRWDTPGTGYQGYPGAAVVRPLPPVGYRKIATPAPQQHPPPAKGLHLSPPAPLRPPPPSASYGAADEPSQGRSSMTPPYAVDPTLPSYSQHGGGGVGSVTHPSVPGGPCPTAQHQFDQSAPTTADPPNSSFARPPYLTNTVNITNNTAMPPTHYQTARATPPATTHESPSTPPSHVPATSYKREEPLGSSADPGSRRNSLAAVAPGGGRRTPGDDGDALGGVGSGGGAQHTVTPYHSASTAHRRPSTPAVQRQDTGVQVERIEDRSVPMVSTPMQPRVQANAPSSFVSTAFPPPSKATSYANDRAAPGDDGVQDLLGQLLTALDADAAGLTAEEKAARLSHRLVELCEAKLSPSRRDAMLQLLPEQLLAAVGQDPERADAATNPHSYPFHPASRNAATPVLAHSRPGGSPAFHPDQLSLPLRPSQHAESQKDPPSTPLTLGVPHDDFTRVLLDPALADQGPDAGRMDQTYAQLHAHSNASSPVHHPASQPGSCLGSALPTPHARPRDHPSQFEHPQHHHSHHHHPQGAQPGGGRPESAVSTPHARPQDAPSQAYSNQFEFPNHHYQPQGGVQPGGSRPGSAVSTPHARPQDAPSQVYPNQFELPHHQGDPPGSSRPGSGVTTPHARPHDAPSVHHPPLGAEVPTPLARPSEAPAGSRRGSAATSHLPAAADGAPAGPRHAPGISGVRTPSSVSRARPGGGVAVPLGAAADVPNRVADPVFDGPRAQYHQPRGFGGMWPGGSDPVLSSQEARRETPRTPAQPAGRDRNPVNYERLATSFPRALDDDEPSTFALVDAIRRIQAQSASNHDALAAMFDLRSSEELPGMSEFGSPARKQKERTTPTAAFSQSPGGFEAYPSLFTAPSMTAEQLQAEIQDLFLALDPTIPPPAPQLAAHSPSPVVPLHYHLPDSRTAGGMHSPLTSQTPRLSPTRRPPPPGVHMPIGGSFTHRPPPDMPHLHVNVNFTRKPNRPDANPAAAAELPDSPLPLHLSPGSDTMYSVPSQPRPHVPAHRPFGAQPGAPPDRVLPGGGYHPYQFHHAPEHTARPSQSHAASFAAADPRRQPSMGSPPPPPPPYDNESDEETVIGSFR